MSLLLLVWCLFSIIPSMGSESNDTLVIKLTHHISPPPDYHIEDYLSWITVNRSGETRGGLYSHDEYFVADLKVGDHRVTQTLLVDTGSALTWIKCPPCCWEGKKASYDPRDSSAVPVLCQDSNICIKSYFAAFGCTDMSAQCEFGITYASGDGTKGHVYKDTFFTDTTKDTYVFGCGETGSLLWDGLLGLGPGSSSIIQQRGSSIFGYCLSNTKILDTDYKHSKLMIGNKVPLFGSSTRLIFGEEMVEKYRYYIALEGIEFGDELLDINPQIFKIRMVRGRDGKYKQQDGGVIIDTGSPYSYLQQIAVYKIEQKVMEAIKQNSNPPLERFNKWYGYHRYQMLCFKGRFETDLKSDFPKMSLVFEGGATMKLQPHHFFKQFMPEKMGDGDHFCLTILPTEPILRATFGMLGNLVQRDFYIAYDLAGRTVWFEPMDCSNFF